MGMAALCWKCSSVVSLCRLVEPNCISDIHRPGQNARLVHIIRQELCHAEQSQQSIDNRETERLSAAMFATSLLHMRSELRGEDVDA